MPGTTLTPTFCRICEPLCPLVAEFPGIPGQRPGPTIRVLQVPAKGD